MRPRTLVALVLAVTLILGFALMLRPAPGRDALRARAAVAAARAAGADRLASAAYRRAELAFIAANQAVALEELRWFPSYRRARALYRETERLALAAAERARSRDLEADRGKVEEALALLRLALDEARGELDELVRLSPPDDLRPEVPEWYRRQVAALGDRVADVESSLEADDLVEAAARAAATSAQLASVRNDLLAWRIALQHRE